MATRARPTWQVALLAGVIATVASFGIVLLRINSTVVESGATAHEHIFVTLYDPPADRLQTVINVSDGQSWAAAAVDPTFSHPERYTEGVPEFVYRSGRPLFGWIVWAGSFGRPDWVPGSLLVMTCLGVGLLAAASVMLADQQGRVRRYAAFTVVLPGSLLILMILGPEPLAAALGVLGVYWWFGPPRRPGLAVLMFTLAVLTRDTMVLVPLAIAVFELVKAREGLRRVLPLAIAPAAYVTWVSWLHARWGHWPTDPHAQRLAPPFVGWIQSIGDVELIRTGSFVLGAVLIVVALRRAPGSPLTWIVVAFALSTVFYGAIVLDTESYRPLLAMYVFGVIVALPMDPRRSRELGGIPGARVKVGADTS